MSNPVVLSPGTSAPISDRDNPRSVVNLVPPTVREAIDRVPGDLLALDAQELESMTPKGAFTLVDRRLRTAFWMEYNRAQEAQSNMVMTQVFGGVCSRVYFYQNVLPDKVRLAHLLLPPTEYQVAMAEALTFGVDRLREILELPIKDVITGKPDAKMAAVIVQTVNLLDQRLKGAVVQRIQQHNINESRGGANRQDTGATPISMDEIDRQLAELKAQVGEKRAEAEAIVVEATPAELAND